MNKVDQYLQEIYIKDNLNEGFLDIIDKAKNISTSTVTSFFNKVPSINYETSKNELKKNIDNFDELHKKNFSKIKGNSKDKEVGATVITILQKIRPQAKLQARDIIDNIIEKISNTGSWLFNTGIVLWIGMMVVKFVLVFAFHSTSLTIEIKGVISDLFRGAIKLQNISFYAILVGILLAVVGWILRTIMPRNKKEKEVPQTKNPYEEAGGEF